MSLLRTMWACLALVSSHSSFFTHCLGKEDVLFMVMHRLPSVVLPPVLSPCCCHLIPALMPNPGILEGPDAHSRAQGRGLLLLPW